MSDDGTEITLATIDLNVKEKPIAIIKKLSAQKVQNNLLLLECEVSRPMTSQFKYCWLKDATEIIVDDQHLTRKIADETKCRLFINKFDYVDSGTYEFSIHDTSTPELKESTSFRLDIKQNPFRSGMKVINNDFNTTRTLTIEFETVNDKYDVTQMKWIKDNKQIVFENNPKYSFVKTSPNKFCLEIRNVDSTDNGAYSCGIDEFTNKLNLSGIENLENQAITEQVEEAVEELAEVIEEISNVKDAQANIIEELQVILDDKVNKEQTVSHTGEVVNKADSANREISPIQVATNKELVQSDVEDKWETITDEVITYVTETVTDNKPEELADLADSNNDATSIAATQEASEGLNEKPELTKSESLVSLVEEVVADNSDDLKEIQKPEKVQEVKVQETIVEEDLKTQKTKPKEPVKVEPVEEINAEEKVEEIKPEVVIEEKPAEIEADKADLNKQDTKEKEPAKVEPIEEVNVE